MWLEGAELYHYKARAYDPQLGRFLQADPIDYGDGLNMYAYVGGDAMNARDPSGMDAQPADCPPGTPEGTGCGETETDDDEVISTGTRTGGGSFGGPVIFGGPLDLEIITYGILVGGGNGPSAELNDEEMKALCSTIRNGLSRRSPRAPLVFVRVTDSASVPWELEPRYLTGYQAVVSRTGLHSVNRRYPGTGIHLGSESGFEGLFFHDDFFDPTISPAVAALHGTLEVLPLLEGKIEELHLTNTAANRICLGLR